MLPSEGATKTLLKLLPGGPSPAGLETPPQWFALWRDASRTHGRHGAHAAVIAAHLCAHRMAWALLRPRRPPNGLLAAQTASETGPASPGSLHDHALDLRLGGTRSGGAWHPPR